MKILYSILAATMLLGMTGPCMQAATAVSVDFFHDNLEPYGDWREVGDYGYCWQPRDVPRNWRPYSDGRWLYTDAGWTWDSDEPYSWAVHHYGRWARVAGIGWVWVPGTEWGPAWVSWRRGARHVGWAPLPPEAEFSRSVGFSSRVDADYDIGPTYYSFVEVRNFGAPRLGRVIIEPRENITIISQTTNITRTTYVNNVVYNGGPQYDVISRQSALPIRRLKLERREELAGDAGPVRAEQLRARVEGDSFRVLALPFDTKPATAPRKVAAKVEKAELDRGWKDAGPPAAVAKLRTKIKSEPATPAEVPPQPKTEKNAEVPAITPVPPAREEKPPKGEVPKDGPPTAPPAPVTKEVAPGPTEKPAAPEAPPKPAKPAKDLKPVKPEAAKARPLPPAAEEAVPATESKKGRSKAHEAPRPPGEAVPQAQVQEAKPRTERAEPARTLPPSPTEKPRQKIRSEKGGEKPKLEPPAARSIERNAPNPPEPRPQEKKPDPHPKAAPAITQPQPPQPPQPAKDEGKGKGKDKKKDPEKPEGAPQ